MSDETPKTCARCRDRMGTRVFARSTLPGGEGVAWWCDECREEVKAHAASRKSSGLVLPSIPIQPQEPVVNDDTDYDAALTKHGWQRGLESASDGLWQACATYVRGASNNAYCESLERCNCDVAGVGYTLVSARAAALKLIEEREAARRST